MDKKIEGNSKDEKTSSELKVTSRDMNEGAEIWLGEKIKCLDHGFIYLVDYMGNDSSVAQAARTSYGKGTKSVSNNEGLIRRLMKDNHTSPFEMVELKFHAKMPIFVARQWIRHRTASVNEYSGRYSEMISEFYVPASSEMTKQSTKNKQGRSEDALPPEVQMEILCMLKNDANLAFYDYKKMIDAGFSKELARIGLPLSTYTEWYWKIDLHNLFRFLMLRLDKMAQKEIRVYAEAIAQILKSSYPLSFKAFEDFTLYAEKLSRQEVIALGELGMFFIKGKFQEAVEKAGIKNPREIEEFKEKLIRFGITFEIDKV